MADRVRVNIRTTANTKAVRTEKRNGRDVVIVPSATLPDNVVMNGIMYPADEIEKSFMSLNRSPAPAGHPLINGAFVSARDPEGINLGWIGAWNENVRRENGRVFLDKVIDVARANQTDEGKRVLEAVRKGDPVHTSTGLYCFLEAANGDVEYDHIARDIEFDHDAILLDEEGAATPEQGVGMLVNKKGEAQEIRVINSTLEDAERQLDWAVDDAARAVEKLARVPLLERIKTAILEAVGGSDGGQTSANNKGDAEMADEKQLEALSAKVNAIEESLKGIGTQVANAVAEAIKPVTEHVAEMAANQKARDEAEKAELEATVVKANILDEETAKATPINTLRKLAEKAKPGKAAGLNGAFKGNSDDDEFADYDINKMIEKEVA